MILLNFWEQYPDLHKDLDKVESKLRQEVRSRNATIESILFRLVNAGGKRLRPALVLLSGRYARVKEEKLIPLAASVEMLHMATLVHDDVIDDADFRRGIETTHRKWDNHTAIFAGDYLLSKAFGVLTHNTEYKDAAVMAKAFKFICEGEIEQYYTRNNINTSIKKYLTRIRYKTAMLFSMSCYLGASPSKLPRHEKNALGMYGMHMGMAFQIRDDLLDFLSSGKQLGKPVINDVRQGIYTLPVIYALNDRKYGRELRRLLQDKDKPEERLDEITRLIINSGAVEKSKALQQKYLNKGRNIIRILTPNIHSGAMRDLLSFTADREK